jgi:hypothetical protein
MEFVLIASGVALAMGVKAICLILEFCGTFPRPDQVEPNAIRLHEPPPWWHGF